MLFNNNNNIILLLVIYWKANILVKQRMKIWLKKKAVFYIDTDLFYYEAFSILWWYMISSDWREHYSMTLTVFREHCEEVLKWWLWYWEEVTIDERKYELLFNGGIIILSVLFKYYSSLFWWLYSDEEKPC